MNWEETIEYIRQQPEFVDLVEKAYFDADLRLNVERFRVSDEFTQTLQLMGQYQSTAKKILDIGCGNGISSLAFALAGFDVTAVEPDPSKTVGAGAIRLLKDDYQLQNLTIHEAFAEDIAFASESFDVVYVRQAMHHANDLEKFVAECARVLKKGGLLLTIRDHVVFDEADKQWFLQNHPLQAFYGGENAFSPAQYRTAMTKARLSIVKELKHYDSSINYFPATEYDVQQKYEVEMLRRKRAVQQKLGFAMKLPLVSMLYLAYLHFRCGNPLNEMDVPGRMYTYVALKKTDKPITITGENCSFK